MPEIFAVRPGGPLRQRHEELNTETLHAHGAVNTSHGKYHLSKVGSGYQAKYVPHEGNPATQTIHAGAIPKHDAIRHAQLHHDSIAKKMSDFNTEISMPETILESADMFSAVALLQKMDENFSGVRQTRSGSPPPPAKVPPLGDPSKARPHKLLGMLTKFGLGPIEGSHHGASANGKTGAKHGSHPTAIRDHLVNKHGWKKVQSKTEGGQYGQVKHIISHPEYGHLKIEGSKLGYQGYHSTYIDHSKKGFGHMYSANETADSEDLFAAENLLQEMENTFAARKSMPCCIRTLKNNYD